MLTCEYRKRDKKSAFKSRWSAKKATPGGFNEEHEKTFTPMPFCNLPRGKSVDELEILILRHRLEDIQKRIAVGDYEINDPDLRPSSPGSNLDPKTGQSVREARNRERYINEKNFVIENLLKLDRKFIPPADYKAPMKKRKIYLPDADLGDTNYIGLIIGPGGKTQKELEKRSKCKIAIRGRGASMKSRIYNKTENDENEPLHVLVESQDEDCLLQGVRLVEELLDPNSSVKKNQLIEIAAIRGTLRDDWCEDCGEKGHRRFECPNKINAWKKVEVRCEICGQTTHPTRDCAMKREGFFDGISPEDDLNDFLDNLKKQKAKALENGPADDEKRMLKDDAYEHAAKKVVNVIEKEVPGILPKEVKDLVKPYTKKDENQLSDRVVALVDDDKRQLALLTSEDSEYKNPLNELHNKFKDTYGKLLANEAVNFYNNYVQPRSNGPPPPPSAFQNPPQVMHYPPPGAFPVPPPVYQPLPGGYAPYPPGYQGPPMPMGRQPYPGYPPYYPQPQGYLPQGSYGLPPHPYGYSGAPPQHPPPKPGVQNNDMKS
jgi:hypothetical protein